MTKSKLCAILILETKTNTFSERNNIMKTVTSAFIYRAYQAIFQYQEYSYAKHAYFQDKQKYQTGMSCLG